MLSPSTPIDHNGWSILKTLQWTAAYFKRHDIENGRVDAEVLLAHVLGSSRIDLYLHHDQPLTRSELEHFKILIKRRAAREPVAYILGNKEFWSLDFKVDGNVLIPRPETECLVELALKLARQSGAASPLKILELGVGSGAITIALASEMPAHHYTATDVSPAAISIARANQQRLLPRTVVNWVVGDWFDAINTRGLFFDLILSNPPYIRKNVIQGLQKEVCAFEPLGALDGGEDGVACYRRIIPAAALRLSPGGYLLLEIGFDQKEQVAAIAAECGAFDYIGFEKDYSGHDRVAILRHSGRGIK